MPTILIVDDEEEIRQAIHVLLTDEGYKAAMAAGGRRAVEMLRQCPGRAVVLFDYLMPEGDGLHLLQAVAADEGLQRRFAYVCMAARARSRLPIELRALMDQLEIPFLSKPFSIDEVLSAIDEARRRLMAAPNRPRIDFGEPA